MRNVTSTITLLAKKVRAEGRAMAPIPLEKLEELAEHLQRLDRLVLAAEEYARVSNRYGFLAEPERLSLERLRAALDEVLS